MNAPDSNSTLLFDLNNGASPLNLADCYKTGHPSMYGEDTTTLVANFTPRSDKYAPVTISPLYDKKIVWFGPMGFIKEFLIDGFDRDFFQKPKEVAVGRYKRRVDSILGANRVSMTKIEKLHDLGYLPLEIRSLPEGSRVNIKVPPIVFINTHPGFPWVSTYFETLFSCENWKPTTVATIAFEFRKVLTYFARMTGTPEDFVRVQGHDFSFRGMSGAHDAARCGSGHLLSFYGTDTIPALDYLEDYYGANSDKELIGCSVPATEHSVMTLRILRLVQQFARDPGNSTKTEKELRSLAEREVIRQLIVEDFPSGIISIVADSFAYWTVICEIAPALKNEIMSRTPDELGYAKVVFRPDSGDPVKILTGYTYCEVENASIEACRVAVLNGFESIYSKADGKYYRLDADKMVELPEHEVKGSVECLWDTFGGVVTAEGYKLLDSHVGLIYGDSITLQRAIQILTRLAKKGFASGCVVFGIGSYTYQVISRDSFGFAMKAIYGEVGSESVNIVKDPATDDGTKKSAKGLPRVEKENGNYVLYEEQSRDEFDRGELVPVFRDSKLLINETLASMRKRLDESWVCPAAGSVVFPL